MGKFLIMHPCKKGRSEKQNSDASGSRNSPVGIDSALHDVACHMVTSQRNWMLAGYFAGVLDGRLARAITAQLNKQKGGLKLHFCP